jgi:hypothetical protein
MAEEKSSVDRGHSGEQSRARKCKAGENKGRVRTVTSSGDSRTHEQCLGHGEDAGRRRRLSGYARNAPVSTKQATQWGRGQTDGRFRLRVIRRSLSGQRTRRGLDTDRRMAAEPRRATKLPGHARRARERECSAQGANE